MQLRPLERGRVLKVLPSLFREPVLESTGGSPGVDLFLDEGLLLCGLYVHQEPLSCRRDWSRRMTAVAALLSPESALAFRSRIMVCRSLFARSTLRLPARLPMSILEYNI